MSGWSIRVPFRSPDDDLADVAILANGLPDEDRRVTQHIALEARVAGDVTAEHLTARLDRMTPQQRRQVLDGERGLRRQERSVDIDRAAEDERRRAALPVGRDRQGRAYAVCCHEGCRAVPVDHNGAITPTTAARWACEEHRSEGDFDPPEDLLPEWDFATMSVKPNRVERERLAAEQQRLRAEDDERNRRREAEAVAVAEASERYRCHHPLPWPPGLGP